jgi:prolyl oligopeptidase
MPPHRRTFGAGNKKMRAAILLSTILTAILLAAAATSAPDTKDPFLWLEDAHGKRAMQWVETENAKTVAALDNDALYQKLFAEAKAIAEDPDRIPYPLPRRGALFNFWQDAEHTHGILRRTSAADFQTASPHWKTVVDLDALSKSEKANWFWQGADCFEPAQQPCMANLSDGGEDASTAREIDLDTGKFVEGGFALPRGKQMYAWESPDTLLVTREWTSGELTRSGYPYIIKRLKRGAPLNDAVEIFRGTPDDVQIAPNVLTDDSGHRAIIIQRAVSFFESENYLMTAAGPTRMALPLKADIDGLVDGRLIVGLNEDWKFSDGAPLPQGSVVSIELSAAVADPQHLHPVVLFQPGPREAVVGAAIFRSHLLIHTLNEVNAHAYSFKPEAGNRWSRSDLPIPNNAAIQIAASDLHSDLGYIVVTGFLSPSRLMSVDLNKGTLTEVKSLPAKFDPAGLVVEQFQTPSKDGAKIPYFIVHSNKQKLDGGTPTILYAYGGFQVPMTPSYSPELGKLWLERGGAYVLANIRGGGEFGPAWHDAGLKLNRQRIYDDFSAVARDLVTRGFTSAAHLGIEGASNGGLLMGVEFTQHPELWSAVDIGVPLLDMLRYEKIAAGSLWVGEYGSVSKPDERAFLASISPYNNLKPGVKYPQALIWTTTKDDRVGPQHARKFAAKLSAMGVPYYFYEVTEGGHGTGATLAEQAQMTAREYAYFSHKLSL